MMGMLSVLPVTSEVHDVAPKPHEEREGGQNRQVDLDGWDNLWIKKANDYIDGTSSNKENKSEFNTCKNQP